MSAVLQQSSDGGRAAMARRPLGAGGPALSVLGLGTWAIGGTEWGGTDRDASIRGIHAALDAGIDWIDTAPIYGFGLSEEIVGAAIRDRRASVRVATKGGLVWGEGRGQFFFPSPRGDVHRDLAPASLRRQVEASLQRLGVDHIDLYQTHWQDETTPISETMAALLDLQAEGKIGAIGVSNVTTAQLDAYAAVGTVASVQEQFNMIDRQHEAALFPLARARGVGVIAYSPLAMGLLSGKVTADRAFASGDARGGSRRFSGETIAAVNGFLDGIRPIATRHGLTVAQLVLAWTIAQPSVTHVLTGVRNDAQAAENVAAAAAGLSPEDLGAIDAALAAADLKVPQLYG